MSSDHPFISGAPVRRVEDERLLIGGGQFLDDQVFPSMAYAAVVRSPYAHARITETDLTRAKEAPGVLLVLTGEDYTADGLGSIPCQDVCFTRDGSPLPKLPFPALARDRVLYVGDAVALVIAESDVAARDAVEMVEVSYEVLPPVVDFREPREPVADPVWAGCPANEVFHEEQGDQQSTKAAFTGAAHIVRQRLVNQRVSANPLEPRGYIGCYESNRYILHGGVHSPHLFRAQLAKDIFHIPEDRFRLITGDVGGSFGMRGALFAEIVLVLWAARKLGRPVKWVASRSESFLSDHHGRDLCSDAELALDETGRFLALQVSARANLGAYISVKGPRSALNALTMLAGCYQIPACFVQADGIMTNTIPTAPYRGAGGPEAAYILERLIDKAAREMDLDRVELRRRNLVPEKAMPYDTGLGLTYDCGQFERVLDKALSVAGFAEYEQRMVASKDAGKIRGLGICNVIEQTARPNKEAAEISFNDDGEVTVFLGTAPQGQGHETIFRQLACEALGIESVHVTVKTGDSDRTSVGGGTFNSRSAVCGGAAVHQAAREIIQHGRELAADQLEAAIEDIVFTDGLFEVAGTDRSLSFKEIVSEAGGFSEEAVYLPDAPTIPQGCHICEIEIDPETGAIRVDRYVTIDDVGTVINPMLLEGQIHGGVAQGIGQALFEQIRYDPETGQLLTGSFMDYAMPRADDLCSFVSETHPVPTALNPLGVKGAGEAGTVGALPAVMSAVADALEPYGRRYRNARHPRKSMALY